MQLPVACRSLSRPSSAPDAKASSICSSSLELPSVYCFSQYRLFSSCLNCCDHTYSYLSFFSNSSLQQNCFILPASDSRKNLISLGFLCQTYPSDYPFSSLFFPLLCLSCMKTNFFVSFIRFSMNIAFSAQLLNFRSAFIELYSYLNPFKSL